MSYAKSIIDLAATKVGSRYKLAQRLDVNEDYLRRVIKGERPIPLEWSRGLAAITGQPFERVYDNIEEERALAKGKAQAATASEVVGAVETSVTSERRSEDRKHPVKGRLTAVTSAAIDMSTHRM